MTSIPSRATFVVLSFTQDAGLATPTVHHEAPNTYAWGPTHHSVHLPTATAAQVTLPNLDFYDNPDPEWYAQPAIILLAWCFIVYSAMSFMFMFTCWSRGQLDWKLNLSCPDLDVQLTEEEEAYNELWPLGMGRRRPGSANFASPPSFAISDSDSEQAPSRIQWWEAIEMQPYRRDRLSTINTHGQSRERRILFAGNLVSPRMSLSSLRDVRSRSNWLGQGGWPASEHERHSWPWRQFDMRAESEEVRRERSLTLD
ncbi:hypothetical protein LTR37_005369 [Vermiconidia calcicola]|uniref:Uncharacterized protein n=1 Tax=Vermiconidia calcicola TaxID=1690605 RepID=A0ACC3NJI2_9PEZI|nr:hypothetical protein LTR37_005369 [Vermiconidia calcicola]